jgi:hypothetical protein
LACPTEEEHSVVIMCLVPHSTDGSAWHTAVKRGAQQLDEERTPGEIGVPVVANAKDDAGDQFQTLETPTGDPRTKNHCGTKLPEGVQNPQSNKHTFGEYHLIAHTWRF